MDPSNIRHERKETGFSPEEISRAKRLLSLHYADKEVYSLSPRDAGILRGITVGRYKKRSDIPADFSPEKLELSKEGMDFFSKIRTQATILEEMRSIAIKEKDAKELLKINAEMKKLRAMQTILKGAEGKSTARSYGLYGETIETPVYDTDLEKAMRVLGVKEKVSL